MTSQPPDNGSAPITALDLATARVAMRTAGEKADELAALNRSVVTDLSGRPQITQPTSASLLLFALVQADGITAWGAAPKLRDRELRQFWPTENYLASAIGIVAARNAAMSWKVTGDEETAEAAQELLNNANFGGGWEQFVTQTSLDLYTQDSGAFIELVRAADAPEAPVIGINHLDAARCYQTGILETPVMYEDINSKFHVMKWYQIVQLLEMPAPITPTFGGFRWQIQYCAITRLLRASQILKNIAIYKDEKTGGRFHRGIHLLRGISADEVSDALAKAKVSADQAGLQRYIQPVMVGSVDPRVEIGHEEIELASLPEGFDEEQTIKNYITALSMALLTDYQEFAPLPGGNLGTSAQSEVLHMKSQGKGTALWRGLITRLINMHGVLPNNVIFEFEEVDIDAAEQQAKNKKLRGEDHAIRIESGELTSDEARQLSADDGDLPQIMLEEGGVEDVTPEAMVEGDAQTEESGLRTVYAGDPPPEGPWALASTGEAWPGPVHRMGDGSVETGLYASGFDVPLVRPKAAVDTQPQRRAGPDEDRLEFEADVAAETERGLLDIRGLIRKRLTEEAEEDDGET